MAKRFRRRLLSESQLSISPSQSSAIVTTIENHFKRTQTTVIGKHLSSVLKKYRGMVSADADQKAIENFVRIEDHCRKINRYFMDVGLFGPSDAILDRARSHIHRCLGYDFTVGELASSGRFGPGSSAACRGHRSHAEYKYRKSSCTPHARVLVSKILQTEFPVWASYLTDGDCATPLLETTAFGRLICVPKNNEVSRTIIIEPELNTFFQLGVGSMIRKRVKDYFQLDLNVSDKVNRALAKLGSITNDLSTIDFSSASDCITIELCRFLLPPTWFNAVMSFRTPEISLPSGEILRLEKISSMGNGFTWELESLIFHAIAVASCEQDGYNEFWVSTFGDDVIVPSGCAEAFIEACNAVGLLVNKEKSFVDGPFRESCGSDWYRGVDIRPVFLREDNFFSLINFINQLSRSSHAEYQKLSIKLVKHVPEFLRVWGTSHVGCLYSPSAGLRKDTRRGADRGTSTWDGTWSRVLRPVMSKKRSRGDRFTLLAKLFTCRTQDGEEYDLRTLSHYVEDLVFVPTQ